MDKNTSISTPNFKISSERIYEEIFNNMMDPVVIYHIDEDNNFDKFVLVNNSFYKNYGYTKSEISTLSFAQISGEQNHIATYIKEIGLGKRSLFETIHKAKSGQVFPVEVHSHSIELHGKPSIISIMRIITTRKQSEEKLLSIVKSKDSLLKIVSHDLRNPLAQIQGLVQLIKGEKIPDAAIHYLNILDESREHAENIVHELITAGEMAIEVSNKALAKLDVVNFCRQIIDHYEIFTKSKKKIGFQFSLPQNDCYIMADEKKLTRVFDNLISNAVKFSQSGSIIFFTVSVEMEEVLFSVKDTGIGIPDELKDMIFDKQTKAKRKGTAGEKTIGLGMYISKSIVEMHQGKIWFESIEGQGSTFYVSMSLVK